VVYKFRYGPNFHIEQHAYNIRKHVPKEDSTKEHTKQLVDLSIHIPFLGSCGRSREKSPTCRLIHFVYTETTTLNSQFYSPANLSYMFLTWDFAK
jgi:hypothetical protein